VPQNTDNIDADGSATRKVVTHGGSQERGLAARPADLGSDGPEDSTNLKRAQRFKAGIAPVEPLLLGAEEVAALLGIGKTLLYELDSAARIPAPLKLGNRCVWAISELRAWVAAGCPDRQRWQTIRRSHF
jgi:predicted DNA-binding transcriptional regulator AlpA